jgi:PD-(D/E)XK nuclease superfamily
LSRVNFPAGFKAGDRVLTEAFALLGCPRLGGISEDGWSKLSDFLRCPYRYYLKRERHLRPAIASESTEALDTGSFTHALLALHYAAGLPGPEYPGFIPNCPTPAQLLAVLPQVGADPMALATATGLWDGYLDKWYGDGWTPMAVEMGTGTEGVHTSRFDLVLHVEDGIHDGFWIGEHKALSPRADVEAYELDGEILGEMLAWRASNLDEVFGELRGVCINALIKSKVPAYRRLWIKVDWKLVDDFAASRRFWASDIITCRKIHVWPKSHFGCRAHFEKCWYWEHCRTLDFAVLTED